MCAVAHAPRACLVELMTRCSRRSKATGGPLLPQTGETCLGAQDFAVSAISFFAAVSNLGGLTMRSRDLHVSTSFRPAFALIVVAAALLPPMFGAAASARPNASMALPTATEARSIVNNLWLERDDALSRQDKTMLAASETATALEQDDEYIEAVLCRCTPPKSPYYVDRILPQIPSASVQPVFFAQLHTTQASTHAPMWFVVAVERNGSGSWKLASVTFAGAKSPAPLQALTGSDTYTRPVTGDTRARMLRVAHASVTDVMSRSLRVTHTDYGATVSNRITLNPTKDGIYGLALPSGEVLSCFTLHSIDTYTVSSGYLSQGRDQGEWGHKLAPGKYSKITYDTAEPACASGTGTGGSEVRFKFNYDRTTLGVTGVPVSA
jgi:hypothetical protein